MKTVREHIDWARGELQTAAIEDASLSANVLMAFVTGMSKEDILRAPEKAMSAEHSKRYQLLVQRRSRHVPVAHITGNKEFFALDFHVDENVLIPRPETEMIIEWYCQVIGNQDVSVCDVGTGSGIIPITLKKHFPKLHITAVDISQSALDVARQNAADHDVKIDFIHSNLLDEVKETYDVITANLPYVPSNDIPGLSREVRQEPILALDGGPDGLDIYRKLLPQLDTSLKKGGHVFFEYGIGQTQALISLLETHSFSRIEVRKDHSNIDRIMHGTR